MVAQAKNYDSSHTLDRHFIRIYTVCIGKKIFRLRNTIFYENYNLAPLDKLCTVDYPKFIVSNHKEESISIQRVKGTRGITDNILAQNSLKIRFWNLTLHASCDFCVIS